MSILAPFPRLVHGVQEFQCSRAFFVFGVRRTCSGGSCASLTRREQTRARIGPLRAFERRHYSVIRASPTLAISVQEEGGSVSLRLDLGKGRVFSLSGVPGRGPFCVSTVHPFLLDGLFVENLEEIQSQARRIQV